MNSDEYKLQPVSLQSCRKTATDTISALLKCGWCQKQRIEMALTFWWLSHPPQNRYIIKLFLNSDTIGIQGEHSGIWWDIPIKPIITFFQDGKSQILETGYLSLLPVYLWSPNVMVLCTWCENMPTIDQIACPFPMFHLMKLWRCHANHDSYLDP